jgi:putative addiction module killer protein
VDIVIHYTDPGYRAYYLRAGKTVYLLLCGGDKRRQKRNLHFHP